MILGQSRTPFSRPAAATPGWTPGLPATVRNSHFHPFATAMNPMPAASAWMPGFPPAMGPTPLPAVPMPAPAAPPVVAPKAGGMAGGFGATGGVPHMHVDPYMTMRQGTIPGVMPSGANIRAGVRNAGARIHRSMPFQTAPLPPPPPPPLPPAPAAAAPAPGPVAGFLGALFGRPRRTHHKARWFHTAPAPVETVHTQACETYGPRIDGIKVTVCNGTVTKYEDAQGNVTYPHQYGAYPGGGMAGAGLGFPGWGRRFARHMNPRHHLHPRNMLPGHRPF